MSEQLNIKQVLEAIQELSDDDLIAAREEAKALVLKDIGDPPSREDFMRYRAQRVPRGIAIIIGGILGGGMLAAFLLSLFRVFTAGRDLFLGHIDDPVQAAIAGVATFMLAELLVVGSVLAMTIYFTGWKRGLMVFTALIGVSVALTGNVIISQPASWWGWLDAIAPPLAVLLISMAFEAMLVSTLRERQRIEHEYKQAIDDYKKQTAKPEAALIFHNRYYPNAIRARLQAANASGAGSTRRKEVMAALRPDHWNVLVTRELRRSDWFDMQSGAQMLTRAYGEGAQAESPLSLPEHAPVLATTTTNGNGKR